MRTTITLVWLLLLLHWMPSLGQVTFDNPNSQGHAITPNLFNIDSKLIDDPNYPVVINQGAAQSKNYSVAFWKPTGSPAQGRLEFRYGTSNLASPAILSISLNAASGWSPDATTPGYDRLTLSGNLSVSVAAAGSNNAIYAAYFNDISGVAASASAVSHPIYISTPSTGTTGTGITIIYVFPKNSTNAGEAYSASTIHISGAQFGTSGVSVYFGTTLLSVSGQNDTNVYCRPFTLPGKGDYTITVQKGTTKLTYNFHVVTPLSSFFPCGSTSEICSDQCITRGSTPAQLRGRVLAISSDEYDDYNNTNYWLHNGSNDGRFGSTGEREAVQWQSKTDYSDWTNINGATSASYSPGVMNESKYFRRVSTHIIQRTLPDYREEWYISNVVTIRIAPAPPVPIQPFATVCVSSVNPVTVSVAPAPAIDGIVSYSWTVPANWKINGGGQTATTTTTSIAVTPPVGVQTNDYPIYVTATGTCGSVSPVATSYVRVGNYNTIPTPSGINFIGGSYTTSCNPTYDVICVPIVGATTYRATLSNGYSVNGVYNQGGYNVRFPFGQPVNQSGGISMSVTVTATGPCGTSSTTYGPRQLNGPACYRMASATAQETDQALYPNPATNQVMVKGVDQEAQAAFYDAQGTCRKVVVLHAKNTENDISLLDLPAGLYHVRILAKGKILRQSQLVVQH
jgi:hypothetical protein